VPSKRPAKKEAAGAGPPMKKKKEKEKEKETGGKEWASTLSSCLPYSCRQIVSITLATSEETEI
jgi:hypothetical protein